MKINILVVEDEKNVNQSISEFVTELGRPYNLVGSATNGLIALNLLEKHRLHIVLTDIKMPQMDGLELIERIHAKWPEVKIIIISGYNDFQYAQRALKHGAADYLLKPLKKEELISALVKAASSWYNGTQAYSSLMYSQEKWDMSLIRLESELFDQVEMGNMEGARQSGLALLRAFWKKVDGDVLRMIPYMTDSLLALNKRISTFENLSSCMEPKWNELKSVLAPHRPIQEMERAVLRFITDCAEAVKHFREQSCPDVMYRCNEIIRQHFHRDISLGELAQIVGVSVSYLSKLFNKQFGMNYREYLNEIRIQKAKELLEVPHMKVMEIARRVGYNNANYFTRIFKRQTGLSPQEYRERQAIGQ